PADVYKQTVKAKAVQGHGLYGQGATIALIDTGVTSMPDVANSLVTVGIGNGLTAKCVNFSATSTCNDQYGHGTFLAGLMVGNGASSKGTYGGVAPKAKIVSVKIAGPDGSADVSRVIAAIQ